MEVENSNIDAQARNTAKKKQSAEIDDQRLALELAKGVNERKKIVEAEREKGEKALVEISAAGTQQLETMKKLNTERVRTVGENTQKHYEALAASASEEIKRNDESAFRAVQDRKAIAMERIRTVTDRSEDPFYRLKSLSPILSDGEREYTVKVSLPEHEAKNLFVSGEGPYLKLSLARRFQDHVADADSVTTTKTNSYQSITEQIAMPGAFEPKKISHEYKDGVVTISVPKLIYEPKSGKIG